MQTNIFNFNYMQVGVVTNIIYYPRDPQKQTHLSPVMTTITFIKCNVDSGLDYVKTDNKTIVFQFWNNVLFFCCSKTMSVQLLRFQLEQIKNISIFLFGPNFEKCMSNNIKINQNKLFAFYVDTYIEECEKRMQLPLGILEHSTKYRDFSMFLNKELELVKLPVKSYEYIVFKDNQIVARQSIGKNTMVNYRSLINIYLTTIINYKDDNESESIKHKYGFLNIGNNNQKFVISSLKFNSCIIVLITDSDLSDPENKSNVEISLQMSLNTISSYVSQYYDSGRNVPINYIIPGTVRFIITERNSGESWDYKLNNQNESSLKVSDLLLKTMSTKVFEIFTNDNNYSMWKDELFLFAYRQFFISSTDSILVLKQNTESIDINNRFNYQYLSKKCFPDENDIRVYDVYSIFLKTIAPKDANEMIYSYLNDFLFNQRNKFSKNKKRRQSVFPRNRNDLSLNVTKLQNSFCQTKPNIPLENIH